MRPTRSPSPATACRSRCGWARSSRPSAPRAIDLGLRVLIGQRQACVSSSDTRADTIAAMAERAVAMAREAPEDPVVRPRRSRTQLARGWDAAALDLVDPDADAGAPRRCRRRRSPPRRRRWRFRASAGWTAPGRAGRRAASTLRRPTASQRRLRPAPATASRRSRSPATARPWSATTPTTSRIHRADLDAPEAIGRLAGERAVAHARRRRSRRPAPFPSSTTSGSPAA